MKKQSLNGIWSRRVGEGFFADQAVPYSTLPVGSSTVKRSFDLTEKSDKVFLQFEGITYYAKIYLNDVYLGDMLPYSEYTFDVTEIAKQKDNSLTVEIEDISPVFGPSEGWENYGGIIRGVNLLYSNKQYLTDVFFSTKLTNDYKDAVMKVEIQAECENAMAKISLFDGETLVECYEQPPNETAVLRDLANVNLWTPEDPRLYTLVVDLIVDGKVADSQTHNVGFREFTCNEHQFLVNGKPTFLLGVCRHDTYGECGHTLTMEQIVEDFTMIKDLGCNYVRLVHYPHDKRVLDVADRMGMFVSEEPGLWWSDTANEEITAGSLEVLRRTIKRDKNHPSVAFWLCFNECRFTEKYLLDSAKVCRECDPTRLVSGANCMELDETKDYFNRCGFDFYSMHPYETTPVRIEASAKFLQDKPLLFTEWGGWPVYDNPQLLRDFIRTMRELWKGNDEKGYLAGACFWNWAEIHESSRGFPACVDGLLKEALIEIDRKPTMIYEYFKKEWAKLYHEPTYDDLYGYVPLADQTVKGTFLPLLSSTLSEEEGVQKALELGKKPIERYYWPWKRERILKKGPVLMQEEVKGISKTPCVVANDCKATYGGGTGKTLTMIGAVSSAKGYPLSGVYGETAAEIVVQYEDGDKQTIPLRNGKEITTAMKLHGPSRILPIAEFAKPFANFHYETNHEIYHINRLDLIVENKPIQEISVISSSKEYALLIFGLALA